MAVCVCLCVSVNYDDALQAVEFSRKLSKTYGLPDFMVRGGGYSALFCTHSDVPKYLPVG